MSKIEVLDRHNGEDKDILRKEDKDYYLNNNNNMNNNNNGYKHKEDDDILYNNSIKKNNSNNMNKKYNNINTKETMEYNNNNNCDDENINKYKNKKENKSLIKRMLMNKYLILLLYLLYCVISGPAYFNWAPLRQLLYWGDAYVWLCEEEGNNNNNNINNNNNNMNNNNSNSKRSQDSIEMCDNQKININKLYTVSVASHFTFSFIAGCLLDAIGAKLTSIIGIVFQSIGWILLGVSSYNFQGYYVGMILMGMGIDAAFFPLLSLSNLYPGYSSAIIALLGAARSISFVVTLILKETMKIFDFNVSVSTICLIFVAIGYGICILISFIFVPFKPWQLKDDDDNNDHNNDHMDTNNNNSSIHIEIHNNHINNNNNDSMTIKQKISSLKNRLLDDLHDFKQYVSHLAFIIMLPFIIFSLIRCIFYGTASQELLPNALGAFEIIAIFSFLPCPILGYFSDRWGILPIMHFCNIVGGLMIVCVMIPNIAAFEYISAILYAIMVSFLLSQIYCYIADTFPQRHNGKLIGILTAVGGLFSLVCNNMYVYSLDNGFYPMLGLVLGLSVVNAILLEFGRRSRNRLKGQLKTIT